MQKPHFSMRKHAFAAKMVDEKMRIHLHFAKEKAENSPYIAEIMK